MTTDISEALIKAGWTPPRKESTKTKLYGLTPGQWLFLIVHFRAKPTTHNELLDLQARWKEYNTSHNVPEILGEEVDGLFCALASIMNQLGEFQNG